MEIKTIEIIYSSIDYFLLSNRNASITQLSLNLDIPGIQYF